MTNRPNTSKKTLMLVGAIAGAAAAYYLRTPQGKKLTKKLVNRVTDTSDKIAEKGAEIVHDISEKSTQLVDTVKTKAADLSADVATATKELNSEASDTVSEWQKGVNKAKNKIKNSNLVT